MLKKLTTVVIVLATLLVLGGCTSSSQNDNGPSVGYRVGDIAPDFELLNLEGETVTLSELRGSPVMINFWTTT
jgi:cytochrome oxidase Cu insertion factor (SCO1/SenC/PrrC family)